MASSPSLISPLLRKLSNVLRLSDAERHAVLNVPIRIRDMGAGEDVVRQNDRPTQCCLVLEGFAFRHKFVGDGRRQVLSIHIPGDMPDLMSLHLPIMDHALSALTASKVGFVSHHQIRQLFLEHPRIGDVFWRETLADAAIFREWMTSIGRRGALGRIAHLFCELVTRLDAVGLADHKRIALPFSQAVIADAVGMSAVHANRVIQELRAENLITLGQGKLCIENWEGLKEVADFDPTYLHLGPE